MAEKQWKVMEGAVYDQGKTKFQIEAEKSMQSTGKKKEIEKSGVKKGHCNIVKSDIAREKNE